MFYLQISKKLERFEMVVRVSLRRFEAILVEEDSIYRRIRLNIGTTSRKKKKEETSQDS
jgi:hypothetical protein